MAIDRRAARGALNPNWKGGRPYRTRDGYLRVWLTGRGWVWEHRMVWEAANGSIPRGHHIHHVNGVKDDNRLENLALLTSREHVRLHDPTPRGAANPSARLTEDDVRAIRRRYAAGGVTTTELAREYGLTRVPVHNLLNGKAWRHVV